MALDSLQEIRSHTEKSGRHVGDIVWWTLADARISRSHLESVWLAAGLSTAHLPEPPTPERALRTAVREAQVGRREHLVRLGKEDDRELVFAVMLETRDGTGDVTVVQEARVRLDRVAPARLDSDRPGHELVAAISDAYDRLLNTHTVDDVRRAVLKTLDACAAVTLRDHGGVYWVPSPHAQTLRRLKEAVSRIGTSRLDLVPIHESPEATAALGHAARASIEDEIRVLRTEIDGFICEPPGRASTLGRRLEAFEDLRAKARLYESVLEVQLQDLEASLNKLTLEVDDLLQGKAA